MRYRGYYYDSTTGFYYLQSRYYDPETGRFLNADGIMGINPDMATYNLFAYCGNNPVNRVDHSGYSYFPNIIGTLKAFDNMWECVLEEYADTKKYSVFNAISDIADSAMTSLEIDVELGLGYSGNFSLLGVGFDASAKLVLLNVRYTRDRVIYTSKLDFGVTIDGKIYEVGPHYSPTINWSEMKTYENDLTMIRVDDSWKLFSIGLYDAVGGSTTVYWNANQFMIDFDNIMKKLGY